MENEIWKDIPNYEGRYQVSNLGRVKSLPKKYNPNGCILKSKTKSNIYYPAVDLSDGVFKKKYYIHQLVAITFLNHEICGLKLVVDHINNDKTDNRLENLQILTCIENTLKDKISTSKYRGVSFFKNTGKWRCQKEINGKNKHLGYFNTEEEAYQKFLSI